MTTKKQTSDTQTEVKHVPKITERTLLVDESRAIERVKQWGHMVMPVMVYDPWRNQVPSEVHYWEQAGLYKKILKRADGFNPHEEVQAQAETVIKNEVGKHYGLTIQGSPQYSSNDYTMHLTILSEKQFGQVKDSFEVGDDVQCGLDLYNGIETSTGLGGSMYTMRLNCANGAVARGKELGTFSLANIMNAEKRLERMQLGIEEIFDRFTVILERYRKAAQIKVNLKMANEYYLKLSSTIADEHMPESFVLDEDYNEKLKRFAKKNEFMSLDEILNLGLKGKDEAPIPVTKVNDNPDLWRIFNETTGSINQKHKQTWGSGKLEGRPRLNFATLANNTNAAHRQLFAIVNKGASAYQ